MQNYIRYDITLLIILYALTVTLLYANCKAYYNGTICHAYYNVTLLYDIMSLMTQFDAV